MPNRAAQEIPNPDDGASGDIPPPRLLVIPEDAANEFDELATPPRAGTRRSRRSAKVMGGSLASVVLVLAGLYGYPIVRGALASSSRTIRPETPSLVATAARPTLVALADTLELAIGSFELRSHLFETRQMQCPDLARGLILVEERWTAYTASAAAAAAGLDSARDARDRALYARVDGVERSFEHSACPRP